MELKQISKDLNLPEEEILSKSLRSFLDRELRNASLEMNRLKLKYRVASLKQLEEKIQKKEVTEHPAWEDAIEWGNIQKRTAQIRKWMQNQSIAS